MSPLRPLAGWRGLVSALILSATAFGLAACGDSGDESVGAVTNSQSNSQTTRGSNQSSSESGSLSQSSFSTDEGMVYTYAGSDEATITVDVDDDSRLLWSNDKGRPFSLSGAGGSTVDSSAGSGEVPLSGGKHRLEVQGQVWTIVIRPN